MIPRGAIALGATATIVTGLIVSGRPHHHHRPAPASALAPAPLARTSRGDVRPPLRVVTPAVAAGKGRRDLPKRPARAARSGGLDWNALAECEASGNPRAVDPSGTYFGLYQFDILTWRSVGGRGNPADASRAEQTFRARILYGQRGRTPWPVCGVRL